MSLHNYGVLPEEVKLHFVGFRNGQVAMVVQVTNGEQEGYYYLGTKAVQPEVPWDVVIYRLEELVEMEMLPTSLEQLRRSMVLKLDKFETEPILQGYWVQIDIPERKFGKPVKPQGNSEVTFRT